MPQDFSSIIEILTRNYERLVVNLPDRHRLYEIDNFLEKRAVLLLGPRGTGKSTFLLEQSKQLARAPFYLSLDNPILAGVSLFELGDWVFQNGYDVLICDEVHNHPDWSSHLKALYDAYPDKKIWASDSSTLILKKGLGDLSRRFITRRFSYLSFNEYLWLKYGFKFRVISFLDLARTDLAKFSRELTKTAQGHKLNLQAEFKDYLEGGIRPFFLEGEYLEKNKNIVDKIIHADVPHFVSEVRESHLNLMRNVIGFLATSPIPVLSIDSLSKTWGVAKLTVYNLLEVMEHSSLINVIRYEGLKKGRSKGAKIFFSDPSLYVAYAGQLGNIREAYFCMQMRLMEQEVFCPKDDSEYDFLVGQTSFEIGGRSKKRKNACYVVRDDIDLASKNIIPLWLLGFMA